MTDVLVELVDEIGREAGGPFWGALRGSVLGWMRAHPDKVAGIKRRLRQAVQEGRL